MGAGATFVTSGLSQLVAGCKPRQDASGLRDDETRPGGAAPTNEAAWLAEKIAGLRVFPDEGGSMNRSLRDIGGSLLIVSQFTLYGDCRKGRRPSFIDAMAPQPAEALYEAALSLFRATGIPVEKGRFGAMMDVSLLNDGPVTLWLDTKERGA